MWAMTESDHDELTAYRRLGLSPDEIAAKLDYLNDPAPLPFFDRSNPVFYYDVDGIGGVELKANGLELNDGASHDDAARELFKHMSEKVELLRGKAYVILDAKEYYERFGDDDDE